MQRNAVLVIRALAATSRWGPWPGFPTLAPIPPAVPDAVSGSTVRGAEQTTSAMVAGEDEAQSTWR
jgi:hypothetical protein